MSEIEKLYENVFGNIKPNCSLCKKLIDCKIIENTRNCNNFKFNAVENFTAEKQLELIKFLKDARDFHTFEKWCTSLDSTGTAVEQRSETFEEALAGLINQLWIDLTDAEKQEIKEILS